jgi:hypothetical protein
MANGAGVNDVKAAVNSHEAFDAATTRLQMQNFEREVQEIIKRLDRIENKVDKLGER